ncbi:MULTISPECIES: acyl-CoA thioesterase [Actinomadura]|uniref:Thioesterase family protein n=1 Tax=Actinomadura miaoliensis TaxID=430685 RepID=A0ABP7VPU7_9ACTN
MTDDRHPATGFTHRIRVRYSECDMQGVVFNANYFVYLDDALDQWFRHSLDAGYLDRFEYMVKKAAMEWSAPARVHDVIELRPRVTRWGRTSFDIAVSLSMDGRPIGEAEFVMISIRPGTHRPVPVPDEVRRALDGQAASNGAAATDQKRSSSR